MRSPRILGSVFVLTLLSLAPAGDGSTVTVFEGSYVWNEDDRTGDIVATVKIVSDGIWDVSFDFAYGGNDYTYTGVAWGNLSKGELSGEVEPEHGANGYAFEGAVANAVFKGTHSIVAGGERKESGTLTLKRKGDQP